jgi:2'-5' RNA ligase
LTSTTMIRCFIAVDLASQECLDRLREAQDELASTGADLKLVERRNLHITLRFLGEIPESQVRKIMEQMKKVGMSKFEVALEGMGAFPDMRRPNVVWVGITKGARELSELFQKLETEFIRLGLPPDRRGFSPHLTIARVRTGRNRQQLINFITSNKSRIFGSFIADSMKLERSLLLPKGPEYTVLLEVRA